jgi:hypothetical protein
VNLGEALKGKNKKGKDFEIISIFLIQEILKMWSADSFLLITFPNFQLFIRPNQEEGPLPQCRVGRSLNQMDKMGAL